MENLLFLGVPILKHITVISFIIILLRLRLNGITVSNEVLKRKLQMFLMCSGIYQFIALICDRKEELIHFSDLFKLRLPYDFVKESFKIVKNLNTVTQHESDQYMLHRLHNIYRHCVNVDAIPVKAMVTFWCCIPPTE